MPRSKKQYGNGLVRILNLVVGILLGLYLAEPVYAFTPADSPLLSAGSVPPNVMLLVDDSGSMNSIIWATGYDSTVTGRAQVYACNSDSSCNGFNALDMTNDNVQLSSLGFGRCGTGSYGFSKTNSTGNITCLKLPDPVGGRGTRYAATYLSYLLAQTTTSPKDYTDGSIPNDYRVNVARNVSSALITSNRNLRIGLATFNPPTSRDSGPGGSITRAVSDLSVTSTTTQTQADANYNALLSSISGLAAIANTPLAEAYYEITRYFRGMTSYSNVPSTTFTSPIQYRCQKNYGVVITDGLPTYDRTFPANDPLGGANLPNWDGINNDGANLNGDNEGDTLYLDDLAKFAYDIDMRTGGNDLAGKSWDASDFPKQNLLTYTVGFTAANQMLSDAAAYGQGKYYQATNSAGLNVALSSALNDITSRAGSGGGGATSSASLSSTTQYFQTFYDPTDWRGTVKAFAFNSDGSLNTTTPTWTTDSTIVPGITATYQSWNTLTNVVVSLAYANFAATQQATLNLNLPTGITGNDLIEWNKGTSKIGLKVRTVLLGDVINSPLAYASPTDHTASDSAGDTSYTAYLTTKAAMNTSLVVNANDGLVNVIDAGAGTRRYSYMPSSVLTNLHYVADPAYINGVTHKFLVDGQVSVVDAKFNTSWKTVAVGGVGAGGKAFYALQLFDAAAGNVINALWEMRAPDVATPANVFNDLGYAYAKPEIARLSDGRWAAFISNGYGSYTGVASLYVVDIRDGSLIKEIVVDSTGSNGLSSVKLRVNAQSVVQYAYGGDLKGQMWKFDLTDPVPANWKVAFSGKPLFTASGGASQAITAQPIIGNYTNGRKLVYFGSGKLSETADKSTTTRQAFYAVLDDDSSGNFTESQLQAQSITGISGSLVSTSQNNVDYTSQKGFYLPLTVGGVNAGERIIYSPLLRFGRVYFTTAILDTTDPCASAGAGNVIELDATSGKMLSYPILGNSVAAAGIHFVTGIPVITSIVSTSATTQRVIIQGVGGAATAYSELGGVINRRIMWRQIQ
jgi:type IV pilus assembly protein PilY1